MGKVSIDRVTMGVGEPLVVIAGPCVIEDEETTRKIAAFLVKACSRAGISLIFKASYDKANRSSLESWRGPGLRAGLEILGRIRRDFQVPVLSDVHRFEEIDAAADVLDVIQVPAFLCRQTDFIAEIARTGRVVNVKKGQFLAPWDMVHVVDKILAAGNEQILLTERGTCFGYNNLVSDFRSLEIMRRLGFPVIYDATHSVQLPGAAGASSGGERDMVPLLARAAVAAGVDGLFLEVHPNPDQARCDGPNSLALERLPELLGLLRDLDYLVKGRTDKSTGEGK
jgi:2-dehydro-3-deoxyphosphooctonate aldolase (KDO 8-P synthase)